MYDTISHSQLESLCGTERPQLVDVRSTSEFASGHIPGAINIPMQEIDSRRADLDTNQQIVLICQSGTRARIVAEWLKGSHANLSVLDGGTQAWRNAGKPVTVSAPSRWSLERQVRLAAGILVLIGTVLAVSVAPNWVYLAMFVGAGLTFAGATDICGMGLLLARMPWNRGKSGQPKSLGTECSATSATSRK